MLRVSHAAKTYVAEVRQSWIQIILFLFGAWFVFGNYGLGTLIWPATVSDPMTMHFLHLVGFIPVMANGWHLYFHLVTGLACLYLARNHRGAVTGSLFVGGIYAVMGLLGLVAMNAIDGLIMTDTFGSWVHLAEAAGLLITGIAGVRRAHPTLLGAEDRAERSSTNVSLL